MAASEAPPRCDRCGPLGWTVERYGAIAHKHGCPHNPSSYCQAHPLGCDYGGDQRGLRVDHLDRLEVDRVEWQRSEAAER